MFLHLPTLRHTDDFSEGLFLMLLRDPTFGPGGPIRARVRSVKLQVTGRYTRGETNFAGHKVFLTGTYGNGGLTIPVPPEVYAKGVELPKELRLAWSYGGGLEDQQIEDWAFENLLGRMHISQQYLSIMGVESFGPPVKRRSCDEMMDIIREWRKRTPRVVRL